MAASGWLLVMISTKDVLISDDDVHSDVFWYRVCGILPSTQVEFNTGDVLNRCTNTGNYIPSWIVSLSQFGNPGSSSGLMFGKPLFVKLILFIFVNIIEAFTL